MSDDWLEELARQNAERERNNQERNRKEEKARQLKAVRGPILFEDLNRWLEHAVETFNKLSPGAELQVLRTHDMFNTPITYVMRQADRQYGIRKPELSFRYYPRSHELECKCNQQLKYFLLIDPQGEARFHFVDQHGRHPKSPEDVGKRFLKEFLEADLIEVKEPPHHGDYMPKM